MTDNERKLLVTVSRVLANLPSAAVSRRQILSLVRKVEEAEVARKAREAKQEIARRTTGAAGTEGQPILPRG